MDDALTLDRRSGLPDALTVVLRELPRMGWEDHPEFAGLAQFWIQRHLMFRHLLADLTSLTQQRLDKAVPPEVLATRLRTLGGQLLGELHSHHTIEDTVYFPKLQVLEPRLLRGFELLDADHHALDGWLRRFADAANVVLSRPSRDTTGALQGELERMTVLLERHLSDEEDLVVPVILRTGLQ